jgi:NAD+ diphosphatase
MKPSLFDLYRPHPEPSTMVAFAENSLDRQSEHRTPDCLEQAFKAETVHAFATRRGQTRRQA